MQIIPTILEKDFNVAWEKIRHVKGLTKWIQVDVIDGKFETGKTFELELLNNNLEETENVLWEIHLMVNEPVNWIEKCNFVGAVRVVGQVEKMSDRNDFVNKLKDLGMEAGLAIDLETEIGEIPTETDLVLLLGRKAGFEIREFETKILDKMKKLVELREMKGSKFLIGVDGGINKDNIKKIRLAGADIAYCGGAVFNGMVESNLEELKNASEN